MPVLDIAIPLAKPAFPGIRFAYLRRSGDTEPGMDQAVLHLRTARTAPPGPKVAGLLGGDPWHRSYLRGIRLFSNLLASSFGDATFDCVVSPPSGYAHAEPYRTEFLRHRPGALDLSASFSKTKKVFAGSGDPLPELCRALSFRSHTRLETVRSLLIVDDILWQGTTAAALLHHLHRKGLPESARVHLACPLWIE